MEGKGLWSVIGVCKLGEGLLKSRGFLADVNVWLVGQEAAVAISSSCSGTGLAPPSAQGRWQLPRVF